uniref:Uncharacterized protein n=1 Tax=Caenorhabditis japonica TaxID=281687 RepID=A0A8R1III8_CAEJA
MYTLAVLARCHFWRIFPPEQADDHNPLDVELHVEDNFPYSEIQNLLTPAECKILRSVIDVSERDLFVKELEKRVQNFWPAAKFSTVSCTNRSEAREAKCDRPIVLSAEPADCGEWLGKWFTGCAAVFCDDKKILD